FSRNPEDTLTRHRVERAVPVRKLSRGEVLPEIERLDLLILGGGDILFDAEAGIYLREVPLAQERGVAVMLYAVRARPRQEPAAQRWVSVCLTHADAVTVRERRARQVLEEVGVHREIGDCLYATLVVRAGKTPRDIPAAEAQRELRRQGADLLQHRTPPSFRVCHGEVEKA